MVWFGLVWLFFFSSLTLLFRNGWYLSKQPVLGSWLMVRSSWTSLHLVQPHLLQITNKCFYFLYLEEKGDYVRWGEGKRRMKNLGPITPLLSVIFHVCRSHLVLYWGVGREKEKKKKKFKFFFFLLLCYTTLFNTVISLSLAIIWSDLSSIKTSFPLK